MKKLLIALCFVCHLAAARRAYAACSAYHPSGTVDVTYSNGVCERYSPAGSGIVRQPAPVGIPMVYVATGPGAIALVCDQRFPRAVQYGDAGLYVPCWNGDGVNNAIRFRNGEAGAVPFGAGQSVAYRNFLDGVWVSSGASCPQINPNGNHAAEFTWTSCGVRADDGLPYYTAAQVGCPVGCQVRGVWPDGTDGGPCSAVDLAGDHVTVWYACPTH